MSQAPQERLVELLLDKSPANDGLYLGPATVTVASTLREVEVKLEGGTTALATLALALPYQAVEGDVVLVLGKDNRHWVVGVLHGQGKTSLTFRGDVQMRAIGGSLELAADEGVRLAGKEVEIDSGEIRMLAKSLVQRFDSVLTRVRGLWSSRVEKAHHVIDETAFTHAKSATLVTDETVTINGEQIHLG